MSGIYHLKCGVGREDITPPLGTILYGYAPGRPAKAVGDALTVTAVMLSSDTGEALMLTCTLCAIRADYCDAIREQAALVTGVAPEHITVSATHTHSGPNTSIDSAWGKVDHAYVDTILIPAAVRAASQAAASLRPARLGIGEADCDIGINRRQLLENGAVALGQNPWGPRDPRLTVLSFKGEDGRIIANLVHYCCHGTASGQNPEITRDWSGVMTDMLEEETGAITGFLSGVEGDQGPNLPNGRTTGTYPMALRLGARAGHDAVRAFRGIREWHDAPVRVLNGTVRIPFDPLPSRETAEAELNRLGPLDRLFAEKDYQSVNEHLHWTDVLAEHDAGRPPKTEWTFEQSIVTVGPAAIVPTPFEAFVELGLRLRASSPFGFTLSLCNTNGSLAYLPAATDIERGGYEIWQFTVALRTLYPLPRRADDYWVSENLKLLRGSAQ